MGFPIVAPVGQVPDLSSAKFQVGQVPDLSFSRSAQRKPYAVACSRALLADNNFAIALPSETISAN